MPISELEWITAPPSERVVRFCAICICEAIFKRSRMKLSLADGTELALAHRLDVKAAVDTLEHMFEFQDQSRRPNAMLAVEEAKLITATATSATIEKVVELRKTVIDRQLGVSTAISDARHLAGEALASKENFVRGLRSYEFFLDSLEQINQRTQRSLRYLNLSDSDYHSALKELEEVLLRATSRADKLIQGLP
jgi:hypothetical protein